VPTRYRRLVIEYDNHMDNLLTDCLVFERYELGQKRGLEASEPQHAALVADLVTLHDPNSSSTIWWQSELHRFSASGDDYPSLLMSPSTHRHLREMQRHKMLNLFD
jgi:hypothetical protein